MELLKSGKTKDVFRLDDGNYMLLFKDDATGADGVFDPGANAVGLTIEGLGKSDLRLTEFFFKKLIGAGVPTHFVSADHSSGCMTVKPAKVLGEGLEVICRYRAVGSFLRRYGAYCQEGRKLDAFVEVTLKDDRREDPPITEDALDELGILNHVEYAVLKDLARKSAALVAGELAEKGMELYDIKFEFGRVDGKITLIDEISAGSMRVYKDGAKVGPMELAEFLL